MQCLSVSKLQIRKANTRSFICHFQLGGLLHSVIFARAHFCNCESKAITKVLMSIYICLRRVLAWHIYPQSAPRNKKTHTWGQIHISFWWKIITPLTGLSSRHITLSSLRFLIWFDVWIRCCNVHIFIGEASLCLLSHTGATGEMMTRASFSAESPNKRSPAPALRKSCNIKHLISGSAGICISGPCLMNESFPLICLSKHTMSTGWIVEHIKYRQGCGGRGKHRHCAVINIWKPSSGRNMLSERRMDLWWMSSKIFLVELKPPYRRYFK